MRFTTEVQVLGMKSSKGTMDNGQSFDSTKAYIVTPLDTSKGTAKGMSAGEYQIGTSAEFVKYEKLPFPFTAKAEMEILTNGKTSKTVVHSLVPNSAQKG
ncbi:MULTISPECIES: hypothetical protein [Burkholderia]|uniref:hypothetical protein n=1 Tax=Burkholderia TaxID=32008 RepID=UPI0007551247|nr:MULTISPECIES: hypothetical protein [Burkholderia]KWH40081.1 hypothetical protein WT61_06370 [Burkholderia stagnalis]KWH58525.1 hypothetical protein WT62_27955 [Burkholderia stagnalis]